MFQASEKNTTKKHQANKCKKKLTATKIKRKALLVARQQQKQEKM